jgi:hypothetical protein
VTEMTGSAATVSPRLSEFDDFLFAPIGDEKNGMSLSVLSALARLDVDPWQEAATLARMPRETATDRMAKFFSALPERPSALRDPEAVAARLIALLPRQGNSKVPPRTTSAGGNVATKSRIVVFVVVMTFLLGTQFLMRSHQPLAQADNARAPASSIVSSSGSMR